MMTHAVSPSDSTAPTTTSASEFLAALSASGPLPDRSGSASDLYDGLIGDWEGEVVDHLNDGTERRQSVEMHFAWVLEGRAVQDLWIAPRRPDRGRASAAVADGNRYGTTLRVYDPAIDAWRVTWINPVTGVETRLVGRRDGSRIVQTGSDSDRRLVRWVFEDLRVDAFHWRGELSEDGGRSWRCDTEFFARRMVSVRAGSLAGDSRSRAVERRAAWAWTDRPGLESLRLLRGPGGATAEGSVLVVLEGEPVGARYRVEHDADWRFRAARVELGPPDAAHVLELRRDEAGHWMVNGTGRPDLEGCEDLDLMVTPYTNTPPLAAAPLAAGESRNLRVAWVRFPDLDVRAVEQEYIRLEPGEPAGVARYRYRNLESGFTGELSVDADLLVLDYGPWTRR